MIWDTRCNGSVSQLSGAARIRIHRPADSIKFGHVAQMDSLSKLRRKSLNSKSMKLVRGIPSLE